MEARSTDGYLLSDNLSVGLVRKAVDPRSWPTYVIVACLTMSVLASFTLTDFEYDGTAINLKIFGLCMAVLSSWALRLSGRRRLASAMEATSVVGLVGLLGILLSTVLAATNLPYADDILTRADTMLGFSWPAFLQAMRGYRLAFILQVHAYLSFNWLPIALVFALSTFNMEERCWIFSLSWSISLIISIVLFPIFPAESAVIRHGTLWRSIAELEPGKASYFYDTFVNVRSGQLRTIGFRQLTGMITFPSFHAAAGTVLAWAFLRVPVLRWPCTFLSVMMIFSAILVGGHYLVDIIAGVGIGVLSIYIANNIIKYMHKYNDAG